MHHAITRNTLFVAKDKAPYADDLEQLVYLDPLARVEQAKTGTWAFSASEVQSNKNYVSVAADATSQALNALNKGSKGVGVDVELLSALNLDNNTFLERNFTAREIAYCNRSVNVRALYTGTWSAKEAVFKALGVASKGAGAALKEIAIVRDSNGAPGVELTRDAAAAAAPVDVKKVNVSISHDDFQATAVALAEF